MYLQFVSFMNYCASLIDGGVLYQMLVKNQFRYFDGWPRSKDCISVHKSCIVVHFHIQYHIQHNKEHKLKPTDLQRRSSQTDFHAPPGSASCHFRVHGMVLMYELQECNDNYKFLSCHGITTDKTIGLEANSQVIL